MTICCGTFAFDCGTCVAVVTTIAGGVSRFADGTGTNAGFNMPQGLAVDALGNVFIADFHNNLIRQVNPGGGIHMRAFTRAGVSLMVSSVLISCACPATADRGVASVAMWGCRFSVMCHGW